jgi:NAD(P)-dependent dehydrogenase (short-subunit alcohol dehydrogenase family)
MRICEPAAEMSTLEELFGLRGRVAVVTGASAGLGVEFADALAAAGADVALIARRATVSRRPPPACDSAYSVRAAAVAVDLTQTDELRTHSSASRPTSAGSTFSSTVRASRRPAKPRSSGRKTGEARSTSI